jgi:hypothetical protein
MKHITFNQEMLSRLKRQNVSDHVAKAVMAEYWKSNSGAMGIYPNTLSNGFSNTFQDFVWIGVRILNLKYSTGHSADLIQH